MRIVGFTVLALAFACSSAPEEPGGAGGAGGPSGGAGGASQGGSVAQPNGATSTGGSSSSGGVAMAGSSTAGAAPGGQLAGGSAGSAGASSGSGGLSGGSGGASGGLGGVSAGSGGASAGSGGGGECVKNLGCKLDAPPSTGDIHQDCVNRINQFLTQCACLPALERRADGEDCADQMAKYDAEQDEAHAGIRANICQPGGSQNSCPGYSSNNQVVGLCLQQMWSEGPPPTANCTGECYEEHGHFINMTDDSVTKVACGFHTTASGEVWAVQNFTR